MSREAGGNEHVEELLDAFRSDELDPAERARVEAHLEGCAACREELAATGSWSDAFDRAYAARRAAASRLEPDWAAQRAAIVARTSARDRGRRSPFWRWAPQIALAAVAALIVGIVWRESPREEPASIGSRTSERASVDSATPQSEPSLAGRPEADAGERAPAAVPRAQEAEPAAPPPAEREERFADERPADLAAAPAEDAVLEKAVPEAAIGAAQRAAGPASLDRFQTEARDALAARDTAAARRALALWSDTLAPRVDADEGRDRTGGPEALADSLRRFLETAVGPDSLGSPGTTE